MNQYDVWQGLGTLVGRSAVYVAEYDMHPDLVAAFERVEAQPPVTICTKSARLHQSLHRVPLLRLQRLDAPIPHELLGPSLSTSGWQRQAESAELADGVHLCENHRQASAVSSKIVS